MFYSTKTYGHEQGLTVCFRQYLAESHCRFLHGYALSVRLEFAASNLDARGWVVDFGSLKPFKAWLKSTFDHTTLVDTADPDLGEFERLNALGLIQLVKLPGVGCETFARFIGERALTWLEEAGLAPRVRLARVEIAEHGANSAIWEPPHA